MRFFKISVSILLIFSLLAALCGCADEHKEPHESLHTQPGTTLGTTPESDPSASATVATTAPATVPTTVPEPVNAPDPDFYFNAGPEYESGKYRVYCFQGDPTAAAENYVAVLESEYGLTVTETYEDGLTKGWHLQKDDDAEADVDLSINCTGGIHWEFWIRFGANVKLVMEETWDTPIVPVLTGPTLPSPDAFFNGQLARNEDFYSEKNQRYVLSFNADIDNGAIAMMEYVSILLDEKYNLKLIGEEEETILYLQMFRYAFEYTGGEELTDVAREELTGDLIISIQRNGQTETSLMTLYYYPDAFDFLDLGERTTQTVIDYSGNHSSSGGGGNGGDSGFKQECSICDGSGKCQTCGGNGYLWSSASDKEDRNCYSCRNHSGKCPYCNGTGKRN